LEIKHVQNEQANCEAIQQQVQAEMYLIKAASVIGKPREGDSSDTSDVETKLHDIEDLWTQLSKSIELRTVSSFLKVTI
jgi:hypothetical protein